MSGIVINKEDGKAVPFVHVYSYGNFGVSCNENGYFKVELDSSKIQDSVIFTSIGYYDKKYAIANLLSKETLVISLDKKDYTISEVQITPSTETVVIGPDKLSDAYESWGISAIPHQIGILIEVPFYAQLKTAQFYIGKTKHAKTSFRVRVYKFDTTEQKPSTELTQSVVLGQLEKRKGWATVNLESENIYLNNESVLVAFETVFMGDDYYHQTKFNGEKRDLYGARLLSNMFLEETEHPYYRTFIKDYVTNDWNEFLNNRYDRNVIYPHYPLIRIELIK